MTKAEQLRALADRCEAASGEDREIDAQIFRAIGSPLPTKFGPMGINLEWDDDGINATIAVGDMQVRFTPPAYTASLDAAMTLVDAEWFWRIGHDGEGPDPSMLRADIGEPVSLGFVKAAATTPALALCAASLRALAEKEEK